MSNVRQLKFNGSDNTKTRGNNRKYVWSNFSPTDPRKVQKQLGQTTIVTANSFVIFALKRHFRMCRYVVCHYVHHHYTLISGTFHFSLDGHGYFYSQYHPDHSEDKEDWLDARNACREYCMDLVSLETPFENDMIEDFLIQRKKKLVVKSAAQ